MTLRRCIGKWAWTAVFVLTPLAPVGHGQGNALAKNALTNRDVVTLANAGFSEKFILRMIATSPTKFDLTADALADLAKNGITEEIISAMRSPDQIPQLLNVKQTTRNNCCLSRVFVETGSHSNSQAAAVTKAIEQCPGFAVTDRQEEAAFAVILEREPAKWFHRQDRIAVFDSTGDTIFGATTHDLRGAVRDFCRAARIAQGISEAH